MPINGDGIITFTNDEWALWVADEDQLRDSAKQLEDLVVSKSLEINGLIAKVSLLERKNNNLDTAINDLTEQNTLQLQQLAEQASILNGKPIAVILTPIDPGVGIPVQLDGTGSYDLANRLLSYEWTVESKPIGSTASIIDGNTFIASIIPDIIGEYSVTLVVDNGVYTSDPVTIVFQAAAINRSPTADAGTQTSKLTGATVQLDGSGSSDPDGDTLFYSWVITTKPTGSTATLSDASIVNPTFVCDLAGSYTLTLTVSDGQLLDTDTVGFIAAAANVAPTANAGSGPISPTVGTLITLNGSASSDPNGDPLTYTWTLPTRPGGSAATLSNASTVTPSFTPDVAGTYIGSLVVSDGSLNSTASTVSMVVAAVNTAPVANIATVSNAIVGTPINLSAAGSTDAESDPLTYLWAVITRPTGSTNNLSSTTTVNPTFTPDVAGSYTLRLIVNDGKVDSTAVTQNFVAATANVAPIANAGTGSSPLIGATVYLFGGGSYDPNGDAITYLWSITTKPNGSTATLSSTTAINPTFVGDIAGTYIMSLVVNDGIANSTASTVTYTVRQPNRAPVAVATTSTLSVVNGTLITLTGSGSYDPDGDAITYLWSLTKPGGSTATLSSTTVANPTFTTDIAGTYTASLVVNDGLLNSTVSSVTITSAAAATLIFQDGFESSNFSHNEGGIRWNQQNAGSGDSLTVSNLKSRTGTYSAKFTFGGGASTDDAWSELRFQLTTGVQEVYIRYYLYFPDGTEGTLGARYYHRVVFPTNNKKMRIWAEDYNTDVKLGSSFESGSFGTPTGDSAIVPEYKPTGQAIGRYGLPVDVNGIGNAQRGRWVKFQYRFKVASSANNDGVIQCWKDDVLIMNHTTLACYPTGGTNNYLRNGYIMGYSNSGFDNTTNIFMDDVAFSASYINT